MKNLLLSSILFFALFALRAQEAGPAQKKLTDSICKCLSALDMSKIKTSDEAQNAFVECFSKNLSFVVEVAEERNVEMSNTAAMKKIGNEVGKDLINQNCEGFIKVSALMTKDKINSNLNDQAAIQSTSGILKRIETRDFHYIIIQDKNNNEKSFIWLRQFPDSENFIAATSKMIGKSLVVRWSEIEVYLPKAKGYYKVKEIVAIDRD